MNRICIVTTGQPSVNPRAVKEADILQANGFTVTVVFCFWIQWASDADRLLLQNVSWNFKLVGGTPFKNKWLYYFTKIRFKTNRRLNRIVGNKLLIAERSQARCYDELLRTAKAIKADWYIGHNLGSLAVVTKAANFNSAKAGFDFEDYHREENENMPLYEQNRIEYLENKYLPSLDYISASSPLITKRVKDNFPSFSRPFVTLLNCFPLSQQPKLTTKPDTDNSLKLFWFSQTVGRNRGLEIVLDAINILQDDTIQLWLIGKASNEIQNDFKHRAGRMQQNIHFVGVVKPDEIMAIAGTMDIGLALEQTRPVNRDICLTNKIFTYLLAGNAIILSDTNMQKSFEQINKVGALFRVNDAEELAKKIIFFKNRERLSSQRLHNYQLAKETFNWESESKKFLTTISSLTSFGNK